MTTTTTTTTGLAATFAVMRPLNGAGSGLLGTVGLAEWAAGTPCPGLDAPDFASEPVVATPLDRLVGLLGRQP